MLKPFQKYLRMLSRRQEAEQHRQGTSPRPSRRRGVGVRLETLNRRPVQMGGLFQR